MEFKRLKDLVKTRSEKTNSKLGALLARLEEHGEVQIRLNNGDEFSIHLGDQAFLEDNSLTFIDKEGNTWILFADAIVNVWTHQGSKES